MHHALGLGILIYVVTFVFGKPAARVIFGAVLVTAVLAFAYVAYRVVTETI